MPSTFLALGDSYTIGEGVSADDRWPMQLASRLREAGVIVADPTIIATTGWTTDELAAAMDAATFEPPYALVALQIGVNNQYRGRPLAEYRAQFHALLWRAVALADDQPAQVVVPSIPDWGVTPFARDDQRAAAEIAAEIDAFNAAACAEVDAAGARWVDITPISRMGRRRSELAADGLHPSASQYARWTDAILPVARAVLAGGP